MSISAMSWARVQRGLNPPTKLVLMLLADYADEHGCSWPTLRRLAADAGMSVEAARRHLRKLEEVALITSEKQQRENGSTTANLYQLPCYPPSTEHLGGPSTRRLPGPSPLHLGPEQPIEPSESKLSARNGNGNGYSAQDAVAYFVDRNGELGLVFASSVKGQVARAAKGLVDDGIGRVLIERAIDLMIERGLNPTTLPSLVGTVQTRPRRQTGADVMRLLEGDNGAA